MSGWRPISLFIPVVKHTYTYMYDTHKLTILICNNVFEMYKSFLQFIIKT